MRGELVEIVEEKNAHTHLLPIFWARGWGGAFTVF